MTLTPREEQIDRIVRNDYVPAMRSALGRDVTCVPWHQDGRDYPVRETPEGLEWRFEVPGSGDPPVYSRLQVTHKAAIDSEQDVGSFARSLQREIKAAVYDMERELDARAAAGGGDIVALPLSAKENDTFINHPDYGLLNSAQAEYVSTCERDNVPVDQRELGRRERW